MSIAWAAIAGLAIVAGGGVVILVGLAMTRSDRDLRGFVDFVGSRSDEFELQPSPTRVHPSPTGHARTLYGGSAGSMKVFHPPTKETP